MSKAVLLSIKPKYCYFIANGIKKLELRVRIPNLEPPYKCYIYCTGGKTLYCSSYDGAIRLTKERRRNALLHHAVCNGTVIGEYVCDSILRHCESSNADIAEQQGCVKREKIFEYSKGKEVRGLHISELKIYDKPKALNEFYKACNKADFYDCSKCEDERKKVCYALERPPQSWCYVEAN